MLGSNQAVLICFNRNDGSGESPICSRVEDMPFIMAPNIAENGEKEKKRIT
jgi:hypothetical protein